MSLYLEGLDIRLCYHYIWIASILWVFCFNVSKCSGHRESSWKHSMRSKKSVVSHLSVLARYLCLRLSLVNLSTSFNDSLLFRIFIWSVVLRKSDCRQSSTGWKDWSRISNIYNIASITWIRMLTNNKDAVSTRSRAIKGIALRLRLNSIDEVLFSCTESIVNSCNRVMWETIFFDNL
jgi:hypothetical protein